MQTSIPIFLMLALACSKSPSSTDSGSPADPVDTGGTPDDGGCIRVNGEGGWSDPQEAIDFANDGDEVTLCAGTYEGKIRINKPLSLSGPTQSTEVATIVGEADSPAIAVRANDVTISWLTIKGGDTGIHIRDVNNTLVQSVTASESSVLAIHAKRSSNVRVQASSFSELKQGAFRLEEGSATLFNNTFNGNEGWSVRAEDDSTISLEQNDFTGTMP